MISRLAFFNPVMLRGLLILISPPLDPYIHRILSREGFVALSFTNIQEIHFYSLILSAIFAASNPH
jgi:hypothetical protein